MIKKMVIMVISVIVVAGLGSLAFGIGMIAKSENWLQKQQRSNQAMTIASNQTMTVSSVSNLNLFVNPVPTLVKKTPTSSVYIAKIASPYQPTYCTGYMDPASAAYGVTICSNNKVYITAYHKTSCYDANSYFKSIQDKMNKLQPNKGKQP